MELSFFAPAKETDIEITVKRSRFIGSVRLLTDTAQAQTKLKETEALYPKATHYCWAYRVGVENPLEHCSDAGEPAGTAGRPILGALMRAGLQNTLLIVTRYFGGVKLGVRGLIDAYGEAAQLATEACQPSEMEFCLPLTVVCSYDYSKTLFTSFDKLGFTEEKRKTLFGENVQLCCEIPLSKKQEVQKTVDEMAARKLLINCEWATDKVIRTKNTVQKCCAV